MPVSLVFDLDGTLVDSAPDLHYCTNILLGELGKPELDLKTVTGFIGHGVGPLVKQVLVQTGHAHIDRDLQTMTDRFIEIYAANPARFCKPFAGVLETLETLQSLGHNMAICTNKSFQLARLVVDAVGLDRFCPVLIGGDSLPERKPDPAPLYECMHRLDAETCIYFGDSETDAKTAKNAQMPFLLHTKGYRKTPAHALYHTASFDDWSQVVGILSSENICSKP